MFFLFTQMLCCFQLVVLTAALGMRRLVQKSFPLTKARQRVSKRAD